MQKLSTVLELVGIGLIITAATFVAIALGFLVAGIGALYLSYMLGLSSPEKPEAE